MDKWSKFTFIFFMLGAFLIVWSPPSIPQTPGEFGAVSCWTFDFEARDGLSTNHGQLFGSPSHEDGISGLGLKLDGVGDYALIPDSPDLQITGSISISVWVKPSATGQYAKIFSKRDGNQFWFVGLDNLVPYGGVGNGVWRVTPRPGGSGCDYADNTQIAPNAWQFLVFVYDGDAGQMTLYRNGVPKGPFAVPDGFTLPAMEGISVSIGADSQGTERFFAGMIDELAVYDHALTQEEVSSLYSGDWIPTCRWPTGVDTYEQGLRKDGSPVAEQRSNVLAVEGEVSAGAEVGTFFSLGYGGYVDIRLAQRIWGGSITVFEASWGSSGPLEEAEVYAWDGGSWVYVGRVDNSSGGDLRSTSLNWYWFNTDRFRIVDVTNPEGQTADSDGFDLAGVQICGYLTEGEGPRIDLFSADPELIQLGESSTLTWETADAGYVYISPNIGRVAASGSVQVSPLETTTYSISASGDGTATAKATVTIFSPDPVAHWTFDGTSQDVSGHDNHAVIYGAGTYRDGPFGTAMVFNGSEYGLVEDNDGLRLQDGFTLSAWVYPEGHTQYAKIISKRAGTSFWFLGLDDGVPYGGVGDGWYRVTPRPSGADCDYPDTRTITPGEWHHLAFAYNGTDKTMTLWVDGEARGSFETQDTFELPALEGVNISLAADSQGTARFFNGALDDVRIYPRVLTTGEVTDLYEAAE